MFHPRDGNVIPIDSRAVVHHVIAAHLVGFAGRRMYAELPAQRKLIAASEPVFQGTRVSRLGDLLAFEEAGPDAAVGPGRENQKRLAVFALREWASRSSPPQKALSSRKRSIVPWTAVASSVAWPSAAAR